MSAVNAAVIGAISAEDAPVAPGAHEKRDTGRAAARL